MIRKLISKLSKSVNEHVVERRHEHHFPIKISFEPNKNSGSVQKSLNELFIRGKTKDLSQSGIAFIVSAIRLREHYLVGEGHKLKAELDLPNGNIKMQIIGQRYKQTGEHISTTQYLIGAKILEMSDADQDAYNEFLKIKTHNAGSLKLAER
ncbi:MAG: PilZ domain-containing protein [Aridibacter sp.]